MELIFKSFKLDAAKLDTKKLAEGLLSVVFATMGVMDKDGDVALPGFYGQQDVAFLPTHDWSHVPMGKGVTREDGDQAIADIQMNLDIPAAKDWLSAIMFDLKHGKPIQEYSYGFKVLEGGSKRGDYNGQQVRYLQPREGGLPGSKIWEVSPVLVGAGENTRTLTAKGAESGSRFADECQAVLDAADALVLRGKSLADLRAKEGRELSAANRERLAGLAVSLEVCVKQVADLASPELPEEIAAAVLDANREMTRMAKIRAGIV